MRTCRPKGCSTAGVKSDPSFRAAYKQARKEGGHIKFAVPVTGEVMSKALELRRQGVSMEAIARADGMPTSQAMTRWLKERPAIHRQFHAHNIKHEMTPLTPKLRKAILESVEQIGLQRMLKAGLVGQQRLRRYRREDPLLDREIKAAIVRRASSRRRGQTVDVAQVIAAAVPATLPPIVRDEAKASMALAVQVGTLRPEYIHRRAKEFVTAYFRTYSEYGPVSLDEKMFEDGTVTLGDRIDGNALRF
jgi:hypothetical protein